MYPRPQSYKYLVFYTFSTSVLPSFHLRGRFGLGRFVLMFVKVALDTKLVENWRQRWVQQMLKSAGRKVIEK